jgi:hypothetical protein
MIQKKHITFLLSLALVSTAVHVEAQVAVPQGQEVMIAFPELISSDNAIPAKVTNNNGAQPNAVLAAGAAPALSRMWVYAVGSTNCGWESTVGLSVTTCNHGGAQLRAAVLEIGYGSSRVAWMSGGVLPSSAMYASTPVCVTGGYYSWPCTAGQTVVGFLNEYKLDGYQNGIFKYQNTSTNSPWNTMSVQISIL